MIMLMFVLEIESREMVGKHSYDNVRQFNRKLFLSGPKGGTKRPITIKRQLYDDSSSYRKLMLQMGDFQVATGGGF